MSSSLVSWYRRSGTRPPRLLLHGFTGGTQSFEGLVDHLPLLESVAALPLPGHHAEAPLFETFEANVDWIKDELESAGINTVRVCGYSLGARLALGLLVRHPEMVESACLVSVHTGLGDEAARETRRQVDAQWATLLRQRGIEAFVAEWERQPLFDSQSELSAAARDSVRQIRLSHDAQRLARSLETCGLAEMPDYRSALLESDVPVHLVVGEHDPKFVEIAKTLREEKKALHVSVVEGAGHNVVLEKPADLARLL